MNTDLRRKIEIYEQGGYNMHIHDDGMMDHCLGNQDNCSSVESPLVRSKTRGYIGAGKNRGAWKDPRTRVSPKIFIRR